MTGATWPMVARHPYGRFSPAPAAIARVAPLADADSIVDARASACLYSAPQPDSDGDASFQARESRWRLQSELLPEIWIARPRVARDEAPSRS